MSCSIAKLGLVNELRDVFNDVYHYATEEWKIPSNDSHFELSDRLRQFVKDHRTIDSLLIIYYGGHDGMNDDRQCIWSW